MKELTKPKKSEKKYENMINFNQNEYNRLKKEFDLASGGKTKHDKIFSSYFLKNESKMRDLYNLKLDLFFREQKKKISQNYIYEIVQKLPICIREKDKRMNKQYSDIKSKYYDMYKISKSFELEEGLKDIEILHDNLNKPVVKLSLKIIEKYNLKNYRFHLSISHSNENAIAFAILEEEQ